jgi:hypothetical protein
VAVALGVLALVAAGYAAFSYVEYRAARARWQELSARVLGEGYDAGESDRRYLRVEARAGELERAREALAAASGGAVVTLLARRRRLRRGAGRPDAGDRGGLG